MDNSFISLFKQNSDYLDIRGPLDSKLKLVGETKKIILTHFDNIESNIMKEIADIPRPACNHDICLHVKLNDNYMGDVYACISCESFMVVPDSLSHIIEIKGESSTEDLKVLLQCLRSIITNKLKYEPNMPIERIIEIVEEYLGPRVGNVRQ